MLHALPSGMSSINDDKTTGVVSNMTSEPIPSCSSQNGNEDRSECDNNRDILICEGYKAEYRHPFFHLNGEIFSVVTIVGQVTDIDSNQKGVNIEAEDNTGGILIFAKNSYENFAPPIEKNPYIEENDLKSDLALIVHPGKLEFGNVILVTGRLVKNQEGMLCIYADKIFKAAEEKEVLLRYNWYKYVKELNSLIFN